MLAVASVLIATLLSLVVTRIATIALTATGLSRDVARFQARSALGGVGFTTSEAESVVNHPVRRRIILTLMLVGSAGFVTIIASLMLSFAGASGGANLRRILVLLAGITGIWLLARSQAVDRRLTSLIAKGLSRWTDLELRDYAGLLQLTGEYGISELQVQEGDWLADKKLADLKLRDEGVVLLGLRRGSTYLGGPKGGIVVRPGDLLVLYGRTAALSHLDHRPRGPEGDEAHARAVAEHEAIKTFEETALDDEPGGASPASKK